MVILIDSACIIQYLFQTHIILYQYIARFASLKRPYNSVGFKLVNDPSGTVVSDLEFSLKKRCRT